MPLPTLNKAIKVILPLAVFLFKPLAVIKPVAANDGAIVELPPIVVVAKRQGDSSTQAWQNANDPTIVLENDGSYTANSMTNSYSIMAFLASPGNPRLNIDIGYAENSVAMTAQGNLMVKTLVEGLAYFDEGVSIELLPIIENPTKNGKQMMQRRLDMLRKTIEQNKRISLNIMPSKTVVAGSRRLAQMDLWRIQIRRLS